MVFLWNWPNTNINPVEVNYLAYEIAKDTDHGFSILEEYAEDSPISNVVNHSLVDIHILIKRPEINPILPLNFEIQSQNIRPSRYSRSTEVDNYMFRDRSHKYPWIISIVKRIKQAIDLTDDSYSHLVFVSGGLAPSEFCSDKILEMVGEASQKSRDLVVFRDENGDIVSDFFIISRKAGKEIFNNVTFDLGTRQIFPFFNYRIEEFLEEISMRYTNSSNISSKMLEDIGRWERPTFSLSIADEEISDNERSHIIDTISINSPYLMANRDGSFTMSYLMANLDRSLGMEFRSNVTLHSNKPGQSGSKYVLYQEEANINPQRSIYNPNISRIVVDPHSYLEIQYSVGYKGIYIQGDYNIRTDFLSLYSLWGFRQFNSRTTTMS